MVILAVVRIFFALFAFEVVLLVEQHFGELVFGADDRRQSHVFRKRAELQRFRHH